MADTLGSALRSSTEHIRVRVGSALRQQLNGDSTTARFDPASAEGGLFGRESATWRVHGSITMLVGGLRALLLQTLHPATMAGVAQHSAYREDPWGRFRRTSAFVGITTFGSEAAADKAIRQVRHVHERVVGIDSNGQPYRANDPHLLAWVHATEIDSFLRAHLRYGDPLAIADQDRYVDEMAELARRLGVINPPTSRSELREYLVGMRPELEVTPETREAVRFLLAPPVPLAQRAAYAVLAGGAVELLPGFVRRMLWLPLPPGFALAARPATASVLAGLQWLLDSPGRAPVS